MKRIVVIDPHTAGEPTRVVVAGGPKLGSGALLAADGKLILLDKGELSIIEASPAGFKPLARTAILTGKCWTVPVLVNGRLCARNAAGDVVCVELMPTRKP